MSDYKQIIVMRTDLNMRKGKMVTQGAHASLGAVTQYLLFPGKHLEERTRVLDWLAGSFTKICVRVESEAELLAVYEQAKAAGLITALITDNGKTEFNGVPTLTCIAIGPDTAENLAPVTGGLKLL
ncbi:aminoacyl-tRNA hydrolase [Mycobacterium sp. AZCC_0083]|uniref:aminoacyl-tRNA hydrolase n=1 Tax=Mycobacterium sp. AZCC_0083 TaxID=2735882 RepID=UPI0017C2105D|nr:aminoacyl-tRNA hydrolase [Mycobacterium sp. AZCC_0083]MBB5167114.1 PTH2 family peptidyl-tRNA hydrolase [Mycobacterium sp. AZCC_0083]